jgi:two-component system, NarL family, nitrate/nitrite response regulator NarL
MQSAVKVVVIDDHPLFRRGVRQLMAIEGGFAVVGEASSGPEGISLAMELQPDLVILDLNMEGMDGVQTLRHLREAGCTARIAMLTVSDQDQDLIAALRAGADGYLLKDTEPEDLLRQLQQIMQGRLVLTDRLGEHLARAMRAPESSALRGQPSFTPREQEVLGLLADGLSNKLIARELELSEGTVKVHVKHILKKLGLHSRLEAALWAVEQRNQ